MLLGLSPSFECVIIWGSEMLNQQRKVELVTFLIRQDLHNIMHMRKSHLSLCVFVCLLPVCLVCIWKLYMAGALVAWHNFSCLVALFVDLGRG